MLDAVTVAKYIVSKCIEDEEPITNLQLQKILYYCQKSYINKYDIVLFADNFEAWKFGPVIPKVYYLFSRYGSQPITKRYPDKIEDSSMINIINYITETKRALNPWDLVEDVHKAGGAWSQIFKDGSGYRQIIPIDLIKAEG